MNNLIPTWWDKTITVYNKSVDSESQVVVWKRTVLHNCFWKHSIESFANNNTIVDRSAVTCRIGAQDNFVNPFDWTACERTCCCKFTLQPNDIIILGECKDEIDEYAKGFRSTDLLDRYRKIQGGMEISSVSINTMSGMTVPHYNVKGH